MSAQGIVKKWNEDYIAAGWEFWGKVDYIFNPGEKLKKQH